MPSTKTLIRMKIAIVPVFMFALIWPSEVLSQWTKTHSTRTAKTDSSHTWSFYAEGDYTVFPSGIALLTLIGMANKKKWHFEMRYNYEGRNTGSAFVGLNEEFGNKLKLQITPLAGVVFGAFTGVVPGLELDLSYKKLDFNTQIEYVVDVSGMDDNFFYATINLGASFFKNFKGGLTVQRTRLYETALDLQRGFFAQYSFWKLTAQLSYFNPFSSSTLFIATLSANF
jgi:hypothetical protein